MGDYGKMIKFIFVVEVVGCLYKKFSILSLTIKSFNIVW